MKHQAAYPLLRTAHTDFARVRELALAGGGAAVRQTVVVSGYMAPELGALSQWTAPCATSRACCDPMLQAWGLEAGAAS